MVGLLYKRLLHRGHSPTQLENWFLAAARRIDEQRRQLTAHTADNQSARPHADPSLRGQHETTDRERVYFHVKYHPATIARKDIHKIFNKECRQQIELYETESGGSLKDLQLIIAYSRQENIKDMVCRSKLKTQSEELSVANRIATIKNHKGQSTPDLNPG